MIVLPRILVGIALLIMGRKAFWLFVGGVGFVHRPAPGFLGKLEPLTHQLERIVLNHRVGEQALAHAFDFRARGSLIGSLEIELDELALPDVGNTVETECTERVLNSLALRIENAVLQGDPDKRFHVPPIEELRISRKAQAAPSRSMRGTGRSLMRFAGRRI